MSECKCKNEKLEILDDRLWIEESGISYKINFCPLCGKCANNVDEQIRIYLSKEELEDIVSNLEQCESEGYLNYSDAGYSGMEKCKYALQEKDGK